jgi:hypothetical protein
LNLQQRLPAVTPLLCQWPLILLMHMHLPVSLLPLLLLLPHPQPALVLCHLVLPTILIFF